MNLDDKEYFDRFGKVLDLNNKQINSVYNNLNDWLPKALNLIEISFLENGAKMKYKHQIEERSLLFLEASPT